MREQGRPPRGSARDEQLHGADGSRVGRSARLVAEEVLIMNAAELLDKARDVLTVRGTVGEPIQQDGMVVVPVAKVRSGAGGGMGQETADKEGRGGGFGITSTPIGAFVIKDGEVTWRPAVDVNKVVLGAQAVAIVALLTIRAIVTARSRR
jgi:uncharacterized spore protein YtfJ